MTKKKKLIIEPLENRVFLKPLIKEKTKEGIFQIVDFKQEKSIVAKIVAIPSRGSEYTKKAYPIKIGDKVLINPNGAEHYKIEGQEFLVVAFSDLVARLIN